MTTKLEQAARQALEALESVIGYGIYKDANWSAEDFNKTEEAITALREALAEQAEQEPVGVVEGSGEWGIAGVLVAGIPIGTKLYASPVRTKDLTDDEIMKINVDTAGIVPTCDRQFHFARAVIAADREKNK